MDYEKKYNEALKWMRELYPGLHGATKEDAEHYFPELRESEDERIRNRIIDYLLGRVDVMPSNIKERENLVAYIEKQKEQKPNIELIQRSWYMEGYHDREFGKEPKWIIKTGEGGPKHELNPRYGQPLEQKSTEWSEEDEKMRSRILNIFACDQKHYLDEIAWLNNLRPQPKQEWSEEDEKIMQTMIKEGDLKPSEIAWLNRIRPSWKPSEDQMSYLSKAIKTLGEEGDCKTAAILNEIRLKLKKKL